MSEETTSQDAIPLPAPVETAATKSMEVAQKGEALPEISRSPDLIEPIVAPKEAAVEEVAPAPVAPASVEPDPLVGKAQDHENTNDKQPILEQKRTENKPAIAEDNVEMKEDIQEDDAALAAEAADDAAAGTEASSGKTNKGRRKSGGVPEHKNKKLNKKASRAKMTHTDAQPGDYFMIRLKGYPLWPGIVCDETMLPNTLLKSRPVTALKPDGTYRADYADGGAKVKDRTFPVMYLHTNEFSWIPNTDLVDMDVETVGTVTTNMRKDLAAAHLLAAEQHDLNFFKEILKNFMEARAMELEAKEAAKAAKKAEKAEKAEKASKAKRKSKAAVDEDAEGDVDMADAPAEVDSEEVEAVVSEKKTKKRKASDNGEDTPKTDSVKKPKTTINLKISSTPKASNSTSTPKSTKESNAKATRPKPKKEKKENKEASEVVATPKEPELTPEEKRQKKEKEILFLRHKLQKGLLTKDQEPKEEEMKQMSEFVHKLEGYADLEVSIIRVTKINKVLKAILKLTTIPKEEEFQFKPRSQSLLDKWNKLLASEQGTPVAAGPPTTTNGISEENKLEVEDAKTTPITSNGTKESSTDEKVEEKAPVVEPIAEPKEAATKVDNAPTPSTEEPSQKAKPEPKLVESAA